MTVLIIGVVVVAAITSVPLLCAACLWFWARWLARKTSAPRFASRVSYGVVTLSVMAIAWGFTMGLVAVSALGSGCPGERSRLLGRGIAETMNGGAIGLLVALWLCVCTWRWRRRRTV
jgi:hypothetical protein